jgi:hypothetical protein
MTGRWKIGDEVKAFDPRTLGVVKTGRVVKVGRTYLHVDFGLTGVARCLPHDIVVEGRLQMTWRKKGQLRRGYDGSGLYVARIYRGPRGWDVEWHVDGVWIAAGNFPTLTEGRLATEERFS